MTSLEPCIYCRIPSLPSREHVLAKNLGGNLTTLSSTPFKPTVCDSCNAAFSSIDQALAERSVVALARIAVGAPGAPSVKLGNEHFHYDQKNGVWLDVQLRSGVKPHLLPQLVQKGGDLYLTGASQTELNAFIALVTKLHKNGRITSVYVKTDPLPEATSSRLVMHRDGDLFVRAPNRESARDFLSMLEAKWPHYATKFATSAASPESVAQPEVNVRMSIVLDDCYRAIAKSAFTFLGTQKGGDFVLQREFDPIRDYIRGTDVRHPPVLAPGQIAVDARFVEEWGPDKAPPINTRSHLLGLFYTAPTLFGFVILYESNSFVVRLGKLILEEVITAVHEFSVDGTWNRPLDLVEVARRMQGRQ